MSDSDKGLSITPGENITRDLADPHRSRETMRMLQRAVREGWEVPAEIFKDAPIELRNIMQSSTSNREKIRAIEVFVTMHKANIDGLVQLDKIERLDSGEDTERSTIRIQYSDERSTNMGGLHDA